MPEPNLHQLHIPLRPDAHVSERIQQQQSQDSRHDSRKSKRHQVEIGKRVILEFQRSDGRVSADAIVRDLSEDGIGLWVGTFIHSRTACWVSITSSDGRRFDVEGEVRWCKHFAHSVHEIGVQITRKNSQALGEHLSAPQNKLASDLADLVSMVRLVIEEITPRLGSGLTATDTQRVCEQLREALGEEPRA